MKSTKELSQSRNRAVTKNKTKTGGLKLHAKICSNREFDKRP